MNFQRKVIKRLYKKAIYGKEFGTIKEGGFI